MPQNYLIKMNQLLKRFYLHGEYSDTYLTQREVECLQLIVKGYHLAEIGTILEISNRTAGHHIENVKCKLGAEHLSKAVYIATQHGIL